MEGQGNGNGQLSELFPTILVVDDEVPIIKLCKVFLEEAGFTVLEANGSSAALKLCTQHRGSIDLLLADMVFPPPSVQLAPTANPFPHVNGYQLAVRVATIRKGLRVILMSGNPDKELLSHGNKRGTLPFLAKPFARGRLLTLVRHVLALPAPNLAAGEPAGAANDPH